MKSTRQRLSLLINKIQENIPDGNDVFGFPGISKPIILDSIKESYELLSNLESYNDKFETIFLKRKLSDIINNANSLIGKIDNPDSFNQLLDCVTNIRFEVKETYIILANEPIRTEIEINKAKQQLSKLKTQLKEITDIIEEIEKYKSSSIYYLNELETKHKLAIENENKINEFLTTINDTQTNLSDSEEQIDSWKSEIEDIDSFIKSKKKEIQDLEQNIEVIKDKSDKNLDLIEKHLKLQREIATTNSIQQNEIQKTIEDANRHGMAGSFKKRKDELTWPLRFWTTATIISLLGLITVSYLIVYPILTGAFKHQDIYVKIPVFASCVWLSWFCAKQYGFTSRIREDYAYKYAVSMAFEGYKNETREIDENLLKSLLELTILNVSKNPISIYDTKNNHGTPYNELVENILKSRKEGQN